MRDHLAKHEVPRDIEFVALLPMTTTGKLLRRDAGDRAGEGGRRPRLTATPGSATTIPFRNQNFPDARLGSRKLDAPGPRIAESLVSCSEASKRSARSVKRTSNASRAVRSRSDNPSSRISLTRDPASTMTAFAASPLRESAISTSRLLSGFDDRVTNPRSTRSGHGSADLGDIESHSSRKVAERTGGSRAKLRNHAPFPLRQAQKAPVANSGSAFQQIGERHDLSRKHKRRQTFRFGTRLTLTFCFFHRFPQGLDPTPDRAAPHHT